MKTSLIVVCVLAFMGMRDLAIGAEEQRTYSQAEIFTLLKTAMLRGGKTDHGADERGSVFTEPFEVRMVTEYQKFHMVQRDGKFRVRVWNKDEEKCLKDGTFGPPEGSVATYWDDDMDGQVNWYSDYNKRPVVTQEVRQYWQYSYHRIWWILDDQLAHPPDPEELETMRSAPVPSCKRSS